MIEEIHPFKCGQCQKVTAHRGVTAYESEIEPGEMVWLMECQNCFEQRLIDPAERVANKEDPIVTGKQIGRAHV